MGKRETQWSWGHRAKLFLGAARHKTSRPATVRPTASVLYWLLSRSNDLLIFLSATSSNQVRNRPSTGVTHLSERKLQEHSSELINELRLYRLEISSQQERKTFSNNTTTQGNKSSKERAARRQSVCTAILVCAPREAWCSSSRKHVIFSKFLSDTFFRPIFRVWKFSFGLLTINDLYVCNQRKCLARLTHFPWLRSLPWSQLRWSPSPSPRIIGVGLLSIVWNWR